MVEIDFRGMWKNRIHPIRKYRSYRDMRHPLWCIKDGKWVPVGRRDTVFMVARQVLDEAYCWVRALNIRFRGTSE